ncbi:hypothetical protein E4T44_03960 [Aureobasidium sp. EXF-8845]|nr:hypothetical protein E4T44_03960 [Aureobasidium sp. EXF-8845]KAI4854513.1 hypothetical protein E4T45_03940 [Aureobasidium sp. EXF-8846]
MRVPTRQGLLYAVFTSGSIGTPKGVTITQSIFAPSTHHQRDTLGISSKSRTFDFSSFFVRHYMVDLSAHVDCWRSERQNELREGMIKYDATVVSMTPSLAMSLNIASVSSLQTLILSGEPVSRNDIDTMSDSCEIVITYGTAKCRVKSTFACIGRSAFRSQTIGKGQGYEHGLQTQATLTDWHLSELLCIEGPLVGLRLTNRLLSVMSPSACLSLDSSPVGATGKADRKRLREIGRTVQPDQIPQQESSGGELTSSQEKLLQRLFAQVFNIDLNVVRADSHSFHLGGDAIEVMRLVRAASDIDVTFTVSDVFNKPRLNELAAAFLNKGTVKGYKDPLPFDLFSTPTVDVAGFLKTAVQPQPSCGLEHCQDVYRLPACPNGLTQLAMLDPPQGVCCCTIDISAQYSLDQIVGACHDLWNNVKMFRTASISCDDSNLFQVVTKGLPIPLSLYETEGEKLTVCSEEILSRDVPKPLQLGEIFSRFAVISGTNLERSQLAVKVSHAQYDGLSLKTVMKCISKSLQGLELLRMAQHSGCVHHAMQPEDATLQYWTSSLQGSRPLPQLIKSDLPSTMNPQSPDSDQGLLYYCKTIPKAREHPGFTPATVFIAASAFVLERQRDCDDVLISLIVSSRGIVPTEMHETVGACLNLIPVRVRM